MKLKDKSHISNNNKNVVYVINNNLPKKRKRTKPKPTMNNSTQGNPTEANSETKSESNSVRLPDNRFLNSSNLGTEIQRANLNLIENPQLRMNQPNVPLLENSYDQRLLQIQDALQQQIENTRFGMNYLYSRFDDAKPVIEELPNEYDNFGNFAETEGSDFFVNEGDSKPDFDEPQQPILNDINETPQSTPPTPQFAGEEDNDSLSPNPNLIRIQSKKYLIRRDGFNSPMGFNVKPPPSNLPVQQGASINFDEIDIAEPKTPVINQTNIGKMDMKKIQLKEEYIALNGRNTHILNSPLNHLTVKQIRDFINTQRKINDKLHQYQANGGNDPVILNSQSFNTINEGVKALIKQNNFRKPKR